MFREEIQKLVDSRRWTGQEVDGCRSLSDVPILPVLRLT
jgi:hypothetical protein